MKRFLTALLLAPIRAYQRWISPGLPRRCRYEPTCSAYATEAIRELGPARGFVLAGWRLLRCNPFSRGGIDDLSRPHPLPRHPDPLGAQRGGPAAMIRPRSPGAPRG